ncbi:MAG: hypothetical protein R3E89_09785 [Thiolinea sp.]
MLTDSGHWCGKAPQVSPLIALMQDQVDALRQLGLQAAFLNSTLDVQSVQQVEQQLLAGELDSLVRRWNGCYWSACWVCWIAAALRCSPLTRRTVYRVNGAMISDRNTSSCRC